jgi:AcrR family transcriptional regulator
MGEETGKRGDLRIGRTHSRLWAALVELIDERGYRDITVRDIASRAQVNRATFYRYYEDKDDLFRQGCVGFFDSIIAKMGAPALKDDSTDWAAPYLRTMFKFIEEERKTLRILIGPGGNPEFRLIMADKIEAKIIDERMKYLDATYAIFKDPAFSEIYAVSMAALLIRIATWWLSQDSPMSIESVGSVYETIVVGALKELLAAGRPGRDRL